MAQEFSGLGLRRGLCQMDGLSTTHARGGSEHKLDGNSLLRLPRLRLPTASSTFSFRSNKDVWFPPSPSPLPLAGTGVIYTECGNNLQESEQCKLSAASSLRLLPAQEPNAAFLRRDGAGVHCFPFFLLLSFKVPLSLLPGLGPNQSNQI
ncbi:uncharacterized protein ACIB01_018262 [Guaruba guarouba]